MCIRDSSQHDATGSLVREWDLQPTARHIDIYEVGVMDLVETPWGVISADLDGIAILGDETRRLPVALDHEPGRLVTRGEWLLAPGESVSALVHLPDPRIAWSGEAGRVAALSPDGRYAVFGGEQLTIVETSPPHRVRTAVAHAGPVTAIRWDERGLRTGGLDGRVMQIDHAFAVAGCLTQHPRAIRWLGSVGFSASVDGELRRMRAEARPQRLEPAPEWPPDARVCTDGDSVAGVIAERREAGLEPRLLLVGADETERWALPPNGAPRRLARIPVTGSPAVAPGGGRILLASAERLVALEGPALTPRLVRSGWSQAPRFVDADHAVVRLKGTGGLLDIRSGELLLEVGSPGARFLPPNLLVGPAGAWRLDRGDDRLRWTRVGTEAGRRAWWVSATGHRALVRSDRTVTLWALDGDDPVELGRWTIPWSQACAFDPARSRFALAGEQPTDPWRSFGPDGELEATLPSPGSRRPQGIALSPAGRIAVTLTSGEVFILDPHAGTTVPLPTVGHGVPTARWLSERRLLVRSQGDHRWERAWLHRESGELLASLTGPPSSERGSPAVHSMSVIELPRRDDDADAVGIIPAFTTLLSDDGRLRLWDLETGELLGQAPEIEGGIRRLDAFPEAGVLAAVGMTGEVWLWRLCPAAPAPLRTADGA